jgi:hypothetical protein
MVGSGIVNDGGVVRPSQLIASVGRTIGQSGGAPLPVAGTWQRTQRSLIELAFGFRTH